MLPWRGLRFFFSLFGRLSRILILVALILGGLVFVVYAMQLDEEVTAQFEGKRWALPARVFARPLDLYEGQGLLADHLEQELKLLSYRKLDNPTETGQYTRKGDQFMINTRGFQFAEDVEPPRSIKIKVNNGKVTSLGYSDGKNPLNLMRLEPVLIGNFYPKHNEDRILVRQKDVPPELVKGLVSVEDKKFYEHQGVNPMAIARAMVENLKAGHTVQGGSTLTQQLVKNFYLTNERSWRRKVKEIMMASLLELHYNKQEILEAYLNEIHLGQDGDRAIHGFGLAAQFYFNQPAKELKPEQMALLIGLAKGAGYYDPRRFPERALERRNVVLSVMQQEKVITPEQYQVAIQQPLGVSEHKPSGASPFPAYLDLVRQQLQRDYKEDDVRSEGLLIFTAMDPIVQLTAETILQNRVKRLEKAYKISRGKLNGATMISTVQGAEVLALVGGMNVRYPGFNHILTAQRQIGSLVKPAIYLTALENKRKYTLATRVSDGPVTVKIGPKKYWQPENYDRRNMGVVTVLKALEMSRNTPAVRIGVDMGVDRVVSTLHLLGINAKIPEYPSILLGAVELTPFEVQQMYQTIAAGGSYTPLKAIRSVMNLKGQVLSRYPVNVQQVASPEAVDLLQYGLNQVTEQGTAKELSSVLPAWKKVGGKTGTTNDKKDSWFAGFSGQHVATVWVGRDDNKPIHMTGGEGALKVWADLFRVLPSKALQVQNSSRLVWVDIDSDTGLRFNPACGKAERVPFIKGSQPQKTNFCAPPVDETLPEGAVPVEGQAASTEATAPVARANPTPAPARAPAVRPAPPAVPAGNNASTPPDNSWIDTLMR